MVDTIDWELAAASGVRLSSPGPHVSADEARAVVVELRSAAERAVQPVADATHLYCAHGSADTVVVDRPAWIRSNVSGFRSAVGPSLTRLANPSTHRFVQAVGSRLTGAQLGAVLAFLSTKVLGQYEAFHDPESRPRLLLVAPNIHQVEHTLGVDRTDFRLWVALHEETHRVQFGAVPWLGDYLLALVDEALSLAGVGTDDMVARLTTGVKGLAGGASLAEAFQSSEQRVIVDRVTAVMSLLEGHADHIMDVAAPSLIPTLPQIRERFDARRRSPGALEGLLRRLMGIDAKLLQYSEGAAFVRAVVDRVGIDGFNAVWQSPEQLPTLIEVREPPLWVERIHGAA